MKLSVVQSKLAKALTTVSRTVSTKSTLPILSYIQLKVEKSRLKISSTNLEIGVNYIIGGKITQPGAVSVPARVFTEFITSLSEDNVTLELKDLTLTVKSENIESNFNCLSPDEFPLIPDIKEGLSLKVAGRDFLEATNLVSFAAAGDETRPILSGVLLKGVEDKLILAATDSYRLAEKVIKLGKKLSKDFEVIVPAKSMNEASRIITDTGEDVEIFITENQIAFKSGDVELISRLIEEGQFPNYMQIIPEDSQTKSEVKTSEFAQALKVSLLFARESANTVKINFDPKGEIILSSEAASLGNNTYRLKAKVTGEQGEILFNAKYLLDALIAVKDESVKIEISGKLNPGVIKPTKTENYIYILMPLRI